MLTQPQAHGCGGGCGGVGSGVGGGAGVDVIDAHTALPTTSRPPTM